MTPPTVTETDHSRPIGRPPERAIVVTEGLVEALIIVTDDARELERLGQLAAQLARACFGRAQHLRGSAIPEIERAYSAAEAETNAGRAA